MADFQQHLSEFEKRGVRVVAASVDLLTDAERTVDDQDLSFPVGYGLDAEETAKRYGMFYDAKGKYLHATGFLLRPDGTVGNAVYSTGSIGRLTPTDSLRLIDWFHTQER